MELNKPPSRFNMELIAAEKTRGIYEQAKHLAEKRENGRSKPPLGPKVRVPIQTRHTFACDCEPEKGCHSTRLYTAYEGKLFPKFVVYDTVNQFMSKLQVDGIEPNPNGKVQLIFTAADNLSTTTYDIRKMVRMCNDLIQPGGHIFMRLSYDKFNAYKMAFEAHECSSEERSFTVDKAPFHLIGNPENERAKIGKIGPKTIDITVHMLHVMKIGGLPRSEALENTKIRGCGHTKTKYLACTNVISDALTRKGDIYEISYATTAEIIDRYSTAGDIILDFWADKSHTASACISLEQARLCVGGMSEEEEAKKLKDKLADRIIYYAGKGKIDELMKYKESIINEMKAIYESHEYERRFHKYFGLDPCITGMAGERDFPILSSIPVHLLQHLAITLGNISLLSQLDETTSPSAGMNGIGSDLEQSDGEELLRVELNKWYLIIDSNNIYTNTGLRAILPRPAKYMLGYIYGIVIKGGWEENWKVLESLGNGIFEYDENTVENKKVPLKNFLSNTDEDDLYLIPAKYCAFRYAKFVSTGGNAHVRVRNKKKVNLGDIYLYFNLEVILDKEIVTGESISINIK